MHSKKKRQRTPNATKLGDAIGIFERSQAHMKEGIHAAKELSEGGDYPNSTAAFVGEQVELAEFSAIEAEAQRLTAIGEAADLASSLSTGSEDSELSSEEVDDAHEESLSTLAHQAELELAHQAELELARQAELELAHQAELELAHQAELELARQAELELARQAELELARQAELELALQAELELAHQAELEATRQEDDQVRSAVVVDHEDKDIVDYATALSRLEALRQQDHPDINTLIGELVTCVEQLKNEGKESIAELTSVLNVTYQRLTGELADSKEYEDYANKVEGKPSIGMKILGGIMLALAVAVTILGIVFAPALASVAAVAFTKGVAVAAMGVTVGATGAALTVAGIGFFASGGRSGLSKAMHNVHEKASDEQVVYNPVA